MICALALWQIPRLQIGDLILPAEDRIRLESDLRTSLAHIIGGGIVFLGLYLTWRKVVISQEGHITDRFTKAIELLGDEKLEVRLGGIFALERIAKDSADKDHWTIMEILTAYVRTQSTTGTQTPGVTRPVHDAGLFSDRREQERRPREEIQASLTVLGRRRRTYGKGEFSRLDLSNADIRNVQLLGYNFRGADFSGANLEGANFSGANLDECSFYRANLDAAALTSARVEGVIFVHANLRKTQLAGTNLKGANFMMANMEGAILKRQYFFGTRENKFSKEYTDGADLSESLGLSPEQVRSAIFDETAKFPAGLIVEVADGQSAV